jgi:hypothetical protein
VTSTRYDDILPHKSYRCFNLRLTVEARAGGRRRIPARKWWGDVPKTAPACNGYILAQMEAHTTPNRLLVQELGFWFKRDFRCNVARWAKRRQQEEPS